MDRFWRRAGARLVQVLFGGTFDPVHDGHVMMVDSLVCAFPNATIHVIPNHQPPHRACLASSEHRLAMLKAAMYGMSQTVVNTIELDRSGPSYTVNTLRAFREQFGKGESLFYAWAPMRPVQLISGIDLNYSLSSATCVSSIARISALTSPRSYLRIDGSMICVK